MKEVNELTMIGKEDEVAEEEPVLKVKDRRKFNADGSLREGVTLEDEKPKAAAAASAPVKESVILDESEAPIQSAVEPESPAADPEKPKNEEISEEEILNDEDPASFINFMSTLVTNAAASLGAMPHPVTGQKSVDLDTGKYWIDVLVMLREKTKGNLNSQEEKLIEGILGDLQMQYLALTRATEEKLKAQAAQKFSSKDILGG
ncbi:MAG: DUF1844 domain-containing protein [Pyrinomonadaceae bacterium]|nr:DUF1844 domain-containing protein [Pyrinomonadaceae bacterium]